MKKHIYKINVKTYIFSDVRKVINYLINTKQVDTCSIKTIGSYSLRFKFKGTEEELKTFLLQLPDSTIKRIKKTWF